jgi:hypothetical protein
MRRRVRATRGPISVVMGPSSEWRNCHHRPSHQVQISIEYLLQTLDEATLWRIAHEAFYVRLYQVGAIASARAGEALGIGRVAFLDLLGAYGVSAFDETTNLAEDQQNAEHGRP